ncbi:hypothetical protein CMI38_01430 [Candidatus Pacearchaeota archaeon]|jgi:DNA-binding transcriptional regulator YiaG|nr:hypothetical protein [Candidatus Pacearchaeota archaeon]|tara:strand:- start:7316 stop:7762 length:447 start_codon:yes stop_codon:yes gene_type:complete
MDEKNKDPITKTKEELEVTKTKLVELYLTKIQDSYKGLEPDHKSFVIEGLDALVRSIEGGIFTSGSKAYSQKRDQVFNPKKAREIREKFDLTQKQLAEELNFGNKFSLSTQINKYETGKVKPSYPPRGEITKQYLTWLKEHGYNPFSL